MFDVSSPSAEAEESIYDLVLYPRFGYFVSDDGITISGTLYSTRNSIVFQTCMPSLSYNVIPVDSDLKLYKI